LLFEHPQLPSQVAGNRQPKVVGMLNLEGAKSLTTGRAVLFPDYSQMCTSVPSKDMPFDHAYPLASRTRVAHLMPQRVSVVVK
jgi:hypothetical protein